MNNYFCFLHNKNMEKNNKKTYNSTTHSGTLSNKRHGKNHTFWTRRTIIWISSFASAFVVSLVLMFFFPTSKQSVEQLPNTSVISEVRQNNSNWPEKVIAPFIDTTYWVSPSNDYSINGVANVGKVAEDTNLRYFNFAFINPSSTTPTTSDGTINWCWGGYDNLKKDNYIDSQYNGIVASMQNVRSLGGDITISVGGQVGKAPWVVSNNKSKLYEMYKDIIQTYNIKRLDLDIEESNQGETENRINAEAIKQLQDEKGTDIILTIPIMPDGWKEKQQKIIRAYLDAGVKLTLINSMTMCYGYGVAANEDYGDASVRAMENANAQLIQIYKGYGTTLSESEAYSMMGATVSVGYDSSVYPVFTSSMAKKVADHAKAHSYGMLSYWSVGRDAKLEPNVGVTYKYEFLDTIYSYIAN